MGITFITKITQRGSMILIKDLWILKKMNQGSTIPGPKTKYQIWLSSQMAFLELMPGLSPKNLSMTMSNFTAKICSWGKKSNLFKMSLWKQRQEFQWLKRKKIIFFSNSGIKILPCLKAKNQAISYYKRTIIWRKEHQQMIRIEGYSTNIRIKLRCWKKRTEDLKRQLSILKSNNYKPKIHTSMHKWSEWKRTCKISSIIRNMINMNEKFKICKNS